MDAEKILFILEHVILCSSDGKKNPLSLNFDNQIEPWFGKRGLSLSLTCPCFYVS